MLYDDDIEQKLLYCSLVVNLNMKWIEYLRGHK